VGRNIAAAHWAGDTAREDFRGSEARYLRAVLSRMRRTIARCIGEVAIVHAAGARCLAAGLRTVLVIRSGTRSGEFRIIRIMDVIGSDKTKGTSSLLSIPL
jgi:hypothetical protein